MADWTIIGVGNPLRGDDGVGPKLIQALRQHDGPSLELIDGGSDALGILEYLEGRSRVCIVDACRMGLSPGAVRMFEPQDATAVMAPDQISLHGLGLAEALNMASALQMLPHELKIIGIEPQTIQFNGELSEPVQQGLKTAMDLILTLPIDQQVMAGTPDH